MQKRSFNTNKCYKKMICSLTKPADLKKAKFNCKPEKNITVKKAQEPGKQIIKLKSIKS